MIKNLPIQIKIVIGLIILLFIYSFIKMLYTNVTTFYNTEKNYQLEYIQIEQDQSITFENNYQIFIDKSNISNINKETFVEVTNIIMSNRKDGQQLSWKWVQENQKIDYNEFTKFYSDLSDFTLSRYNENIKLERRKQEIVKLHNFLIETFPGIIYNYFFKFQKLKYEKGIIL